jgi:hypothetical protein
MTSDRGGGVRMPALLCDPPAWEQPLKSARTRTTHKLQGTAACKNPNSCKMRGDLRNAQWWKEVTFH